MKRDELTKEQSRIKNEFVDKIVERRYDLGISQRALSAKTGLSLCVIDGLENKRRDVSLSNLIRYTSGLGIDLSKVIENLI